MPKIHIDANFVQRDGIAAVICPTSTEKQFPNIFLFISPKDVIERWTRELNTRNSTQDKILLQRRIDKYADQGFGHAYLKDERLAQMVQETLLRDDGKKYHLSAWVVMPNHVHLLLTRFEHYELSDLMQAFKSITAHRANKSLGRRGEFWMRVFRSLHPEYEALPEDD